MSEDGGSAGRNGGVGQAGLGLGLGPRQAEEGIDPAVSMEAGRADIAPSAADVGGAEDAGAKALKTAGEALTVLGLGTGNLALGVLGLGMTAFGNIPGLKGKEGPLPPATKPTEAAERTQRRLAAGLAQREEAQPAAAPLAEAEETLGGGIAEQPWWASIFQRPASVWAPHLRRVG